MRYIPKEEQEKAVRFIDALNENNIGYGIDPSDGNMYFNSEEDKKQAEELEKELGL